MKVKLGSNTYIRQNALKIRVITRDKEGNYIIKRSTQEEDITIVNMYAPK